MSNHPSRYHPGSAPTVRLSRRDQRARNAIETQAALEQYQIRRRADVGNERLRAATRVGTRALEAQALVSMTERLIVETEPGAIHGVSYLAQRVTIGLGQIIDKTIEEVC